MGGMLCGLYCIIAVDTQILPTGVSAMANDQQVECLTVGGNVTLTCNSEGFPRPEIIFLKDSVPIIPGSRRVTSIRNDQVRTKCYFVIRDCSRLDHFMWWYKFCFTDPYN